MAAVGVVVAFVNATSDIIEFQRAGVAYRWWEAVVWEATSASIIIAMAPLIGLAVQRWTPRADNLLRTGLIHLGLTVPFAAAHIVAIWISREAIYAAAGARYGFFDDGVAMTALYEWRKDVLIYAAIAATYYGLQRFADRPATARPGDARIELREGNASVFVAPADILLVEAAGNYVEFHTAAKKHLIRGTLASWATRLEAQGFVRVHRARLINRARIRALTPTPSGDLEIALDDGRTVAGSRRYRDALER
ncbi:response regulator of the LytR/AlgR family [alpha proteobacterium U9-1i]|nr:response regulator of the LytR/AlgR family [alpha proteobacterium U9-1i]